MVFLHDGHCWAAQSINVGRDLMVLCREHLPNKWTEWGCSLCLISVADVLNIGAGTHPSYVYMRLSMSLSMEVHVDVEITLIPSHPICQQYWHSV